MSSSVRRGLPRPPTWAWVVMAIGVGAIVVLLPFALNRGVVDDPGRTSSATTSRATPTPTPTTTAPPPPIQVLVIGDNFTSGSPTGGYGEAGWPQIVATELRSEGLDVTVDVLASDGGGYTEPGLAGVTFVELARSATPDHDLVVLSGGTNDRASRQVIEAAADDANSAVWDIAPDAYLLSVGPVSVDADPPAAVLTARQGVLSASRLAGVPFVDPIEDGWFTGDGGMLIGADGRHPTDEGHRYIANRLLPVLREQLRLVARTL
jgi:lysophospholipase L1-like esterase